MKNSRIENNLLAAIKTMRNACDDAERYAKSGDSRSVQRVLHLLTWGFANASSSIESALSAVEDENELKIYILEESIESQNAAK